MSDYARVLHATERIREEAFQRLLGRDHDERFDPIFDSLLDLYDVLEAFDGQTAVDPSGGSEGGTRRENAAEAASG
jgi:hypothetical protein